MSSDNITTFNIKNGKIAYTISPNNIWPRLYQKGELETTDKNIADIIQDLIWGVLHPTSSTRRLKQFNDDIRAKCRSLKTKSTFELDWAYGLNRNNGFYAVFIENIGLPLFRKTWNIDGNKEENIAPVVAFEEETARLYEEADRPFLEGDKIKTGCAIRSDLFPNYVVLLADNFESVYLAKREKYNNKGVLDNSCGDAIEFKTSDFSKTNYDLLFSFLANGYGLFKLPEETINKIMEILRGAASQEKISFEELRTIEYLYTYGYDLLRQAQNQ